MRWLPSPLASVLQGGGACPALAWPRAPLSPKRKARCREAPVAPSSTCTASSWRMRSAQTSKLHIVRFSRFALTAFSPHDQQPTTRQQTTRTPLSENEHGAALCARFTRFADRRCDITVSGAHLRPATITKTTSAVLVKANSAITTKPCCPADTATAASVVRPAFMLPPPATGSGQRTPLLPLCFPR